MCASTGTRTGSTSDDTSRSKNEGDVVKSLYYVFGAPVISGTRQFPNPPITMGTTIKKNIRNAGAGMTIIYNWSPPSMLQVSITEHRFIDLRYCLLF